MNIEQLIEDPINPRRIRHKRFKDLVRSLLRMPMGLFYNPIKYDPDREIEGRFPVIAGNMRTRGLKHIKDMSEEELEEYITEIESKGEWQYYDLITKFRKDGELLAGWAIAVDELPEAQRQEFMLVDNIQFGEIDWDALKENFDMDFESLGFEDAEWINEDVDFESFFEPNNALSPGRGDRKSIVFVFDGAEDYERALEWVANCKDQGISKEAALIRMI